MKSGIILSNLLKRVIKCITNGGGEKKIEMRVLSNPIQEKKKKKFNF